MRFLALVPARGGSKRLPRKNIRFLGTKPLIVWTIDVAKKIADICDVLVSTDDRSIASICKEAGAFVPWLRPSSLATDIASSADVALHALDWYEGERGAIDGLILLQPTSPFRTADTILQAITLFKNNEGKCSVVSFSPAASHPAWCFRGTTNGMEPFLGWDNLGHRTQELEPAWVLNGAIYITPPSLLRTERTFLTQHSQPLFMESTLESIDIDTLSDFKLCEAALFDKENKNKEGGFKCEVQQAGGNIRRH